MFSIWFDATIWSLISRNGGVAPGDGSGNRSTLQRLIEIFD